MADLEQCANALHESSITESGNTKVGKVFREVLEPQASSDPDGAYQPHRIPKDPSTGGAQMFFITETEVRPDGYVVLSHSRDWERWLQNNIPETVHRQIRLRLNSNLKHILVGLELKAALIEPHENRGPGERPVLFEPYFQNLISEFCVAAFSVVEGLGAAHWLDQNGNDGLDGPAIYRNQWLPALCAVYDENGEHGLQDAVESTLGVRDKLHQDRLGMREDIDWHTFSYAAAFMPTRRAIGIILLRNPDLVPEASNLRI